jgi:hypothetical protein
MQEAGELRAGPARPCTAPGRSHPPQIRPGQCAVAVLQLRLPPTPASPRRGGLCRRQQRRPRTTGWASAYPGGLSRGKAGSGRLCPRRRPAWPAAPWSRVRAQVEVHAGQRQQQCRLLPRPRQHQRLRRHRQGGSRSLVGCRCSRMQMTGCNTPARVLKKQVAARQVFGALSQLCLTKLQLVQQSQLTRPVYVRLSAAHVKQFQVQSSGPSQP